jgi:putative methyltransferase
MVKKENGFIMTKQIIQFIQINNSFGNNYFLPYTSGILQSYLMADEISDHLTFKPFIYIKEDVDTIIQNIGHADILCISCYIWNWKISLEIARRYKQINPRCEIILGGPQIPTDSVRLMEEHSYIDAMIHGEGEETLRETIISNNRIYSGKPRIPITDISVIPSPYISGIFDNLISNHPSDVSFVASWETCRGCPYSCTYCDWGTNSPKLRHFNIDRLEKEMEWFAHNRVELLFSCDSNFGINITDLDIVKKLAELKKQYGFPKTFRACNAKNSNASIFEIEKVLYDNHMSKGASISMQSLSPTVLNNIKRHNIPIEQFFELQKMYMNNGMMTYTELIMALPGETYESFADGIDTLLKHGQHQQINIYNCSMMVNSEMYQPEYRKWHGIKTIEIPLFMAHSGTHDSNDIVEMEEIVIATNTMSVEEWRRTYIFIWAVLCFHFLGITQLMAIFMYGRHGMSYRKFYELLIEFMYSSRSRLLLEELEQTHEVLDQVLEGKGFDQFLLGCGNVSWPMEEASFIYLIQQKEELYDELEMFIETLGIENNNNELYELILYQKSRIVSHEDNNMGITLTHNFK